MLRRCVPKSHKFSNPMVRGVGAVKDKVQEGLPRFPNPTVTGNLRLLDYIGTGAFAASGSMVAASCGLNFTGCVMIGSTTALGGGCIRDVMFHKPFFLMEEREYLYIAVGCAIVTSCLAFVSDLPYRDGWDRVMWWLDTLGISAFCVIGTMFGARLEMGPLFALVCTVLTCTGGGVLRDCMCQRPVRVLNSHQEAYVETTIMGGSVYLLLRRLHAPLQLRAFAGFCTTFAGRALASSYDLCAPIAQDVQERL